MTYHHLSAFFCQPETLLDWDLATVRMIRAFRLAVMIEKAGRELQPLLARHLGDGRAASRLVLVMITIQQVWPNEFIIGRPCCARLSVDEGLLASLFDRARARDRYGFDSVSRDCLSEDTRTLIFNTMQPLAAIWPKG